MQTEDWVLWISGLLFTGSGLYTLARRGGSMDWHWYFCLMFGVAMIYAEALNVLPLKELTCRILDGRSYHFLRAPAIKSTDEFCTISYIIPLR